MSHDLERACRLTAEAHDILTRLVQLPPDHEECSPYSYRQVCAQRDQWRTRAEAAEAFQMRARPALLDIAMAKPDTATQTLAQTAADALREPDPPPQRPGPRLRFSKPDVS